MAAGVARGMSAPVWRLIIDGARPGAYNMALDAAMLRARADGAIPPTLRLYRWTKPTVTLGRFQPDDDVDRQACERFGLDVVRRPTGGRGVLHDDELTYAVIAGTEDGMPAGVAASYRFLSQALAHAYHELGVPAEVTARPRGERGARACYLHATQADLSLGAAKLSGSAQVWERGAVLQHGSFVRTRDVAREAAVFRLDARQHAELAASTATLEDALGRAPEFNTIIIAVIAGFERTLGITLVEGALGSDEAAFADARIHEFTVNWRLMGGRRDA